MKLRDAVLAGRFCGLETVEECWHNIHLHYGPCIPFDQHPKEFGELNQEYADYLAGDLILDWPAIEAEVEEELKKYEQYCNDNPPGDCQEIDFGK